METDRPTAFDDERLIARTTSASRGLDALSDDLVHHEGLAILGTLAASIAHEFASLLTPLKMHAQLVKRQPDNTAAANRLADEVLDSANRGVALIDAILALAPNAACDPEPECSTGNIRETPPDPRAATDLATIARSVMDQMGDGPGAVLSIEPGLRVAMPDAVVERILGNLIENARRAIAEGGSISITAWAVRSDDIGAESADSNRYSPTASQGNRPGMGFGCSTGNIGNQYGSASECSTGNIDGQWDGGGPCSTGNIENLDDARPGCSAGKRHQGGGALPAYSSSPQTVRPMLRLEVRDTGHGMDRETAKRLFDPFVSGPTRGRKGLGLAIVAGLVRQHGGVIRCDSGEEKGTVFTIDLPADRRGSARAA